MTILSRAWILGWILRFRGGERCSSEGGGGGGFLTPLGCDMGFIEEVEGAFSLHSGLEHMAWRW